LKKGVVFPHPVGIVISKSVEIGSGTKIYQNVTLGAKDTRCLAYPVIGQNVIIYSGAAVIGGVRVGHNSVIGANALVLKDVPDNAVVAGIPAKQIANNDLTNKVNEIIIQNRQTEKEYYNKLAYNKVFMNLNAGSICVDLGANIGEVTNILSKSGAEVHAFEPNPDAFKKLQERFRDNSKIHIYNKGALDKNTTMKLYMSPLSCYNKEYYSQMSSVYSSKINIDKNNFVEVDIIDFSDFLEKLNGNVDILKIDIEGAEYCILEKIIENNLYKKCKNILVETHEDRIPELQEIALRVRSMIEKRAITNIDLNWI
jgi:FkbM family methyltransferase